MEPTYIDDLVDGIIRCGTQESAIGKIYILGGGGYVPLNQLVATIVDELKVGIEPPLYRRRVDFFKKNRAFDNSKAKRELGFEPKLT